MTGKTLQELLAVNLSGSVVSRAYVTSKKDLAKTLAGRKEVTGRLGAINEAAKAGDQKLATLQERLVRQERELEALKLR